MVVWCSHKRNTSRYPFTWQPNQRPIQIVPLFTSVANKKHKNCPDLMLSSQLLCEKPNTWAHINCGKKNCGERSFPSLFVCCLPFIQFSLFPVQLLSIVFRTTSNILLHARAASALPKHGVNMHCPKWVASFSGRLDLLNIYFFLVEPKKDHQETELKSHCNFLRSFFGARLRSIKPICSRIQFKWMHSSFEFRFLPQNWTWHDSGDVHFWQHILKHYLRFTIINFKHIWCRHFKCHNWFEIFWFTSFKLEWAKDSFDQIKFTKPKWLLIQSFRF